MGHGPGRLFWISQDRKPPEVRFPDGAAIRDLRIVHLHPTNLPSRAPRNGAPAAVLVDLSDVATFDAAVRRIALVSRAIPAPVIALGGPREASFHLEAALAGAVACLPPEPAPTELGTLLVLAIEQYLIQRELRRSHAALAESRNQYRRLFQHNPVPTYVVDAATLDFLDANPAASEALGYPREALLRLGPAQLWTQSGREDLIPDLLGEGADVGPVRVRQRHQDGSVVEGELESVRLEYDGRSAYLVTVSSVGERLRREEDLARAREAVATRDVRREVSTSLAPLMERLERDLEVLGIATGARGQRSAESERLQGVLDELREHAQRFSELGANSHAKPTIDPKAPGILLVEDDAAVRFVICEMLEFDGHRVVEAESAQEALEALGKEANIKLVICDIGLPDMRGPKLVRKLRQRTPDLKILVISGYLDEALTTRDIPGPKLPFLAKPFSAKELLAKVRELLGEPPPPERDLAGAGGED